LNQCGREEPARNSFELSKKVNDNRARPRYVLPLGELNMRQDLRVILDDGTL
jgi:hypothetical protein